MTRVAQSSPERFQSFTQTTLRDASREDKTGKLAVCFVNNWARGRQGEQAGSCPRVRANTRTQRDIAKRRNQR